MKDELFRKHKILIEYRHLKIRLEEMTIDYCSLLTKLTRVTQNISPMPSSHNGRDTYDENIFELAHKFLQIEDVHAKIRFIKRRVQSLPMRERIVIQLYYMNGVRMEDIAKILNVTSRRVRQIKTSGLELIDL